MFSASSSSAIVMGPHLSLSKESLCMEQEPRQSGVAVSVLSQQAPLQSLSSSLSWPIGGWVVWSCLAVLNSIPVHKCLELEAGEWRAIVCDHGLRNSMSSKHFSQLSNTVVAGGSRYHSNNFQTTLKRNLLPQGTCVLGRDQHNSRARTLDCNGPLMIPTVNTHQW